MEAEDIETVEPIELLSRSGRLTSQQILLGPRHDPIEVIKIYSDVEWEEFIREWAESLRGRLSPRLIAAKFAPWEAAAH
jgi:hypothetical protein